MFLLDTTTLCFSPTDLDQFVLQVPSHFLSVKERTICTHGNLESSFGHPNNFVYQFNSQGCKLLVSTREVFSLHSSVWKLRTSCHYRPDPAAKTVFGTCKFSIL